jgi:membrane-associated phospholipid phosphatase
MPFFLWLVIGGILYIAYTPQQLFAAVNTNNSAFGDVAMYYATWMGEGLTITLLLLALLFIPALRNWRYMLVALLCVGLPSLITQVIKQLNDLPRPINYFHHAAWIHFSPAWGEELMHNSFPSGHTTGAFGMFSLLSMLLPYKHRAYGLLFFLLALAVAYSRMYLAAHFFRDVYVGSILGSLTSLLVYTIINKYSPIVQNK